MQASSSRRFDHSNESIISSDSSPNSSFISSSDKPGNSKSVPKTRKPYKMKSSYNVFEDIFCIGKSTLSCMFKTAPIRNFVNREYEALRIRRRKKTDHISHKDMEKLFALYRMNIIDFEKFMINFASGSSSILGVNRIDNNYYKINCNRSEFTSIINKLEKELGLQRLQCTFKNPEAHKDPSKITLISFNQLIFSEPGSQISNQTPNDINPTRNSTSTETKSQHSAPKSILNEPNLYKKLNPKELGDQFPKEFYFAMNALKVSRKQLLCALIKQSRGSEIKVDDVFQMISATSHLDMMPRL